MEPAEMLLVFQWHQKTNALSVVTLSKSAATINNWVAAGLNIRAQIMGVTFPTQ
jgi:hypothetical protein